MKVITQKQKRLAIARAAELLQQDGWIESKTVQQWLDDAEFKPAQFPTSLSALQMLQLLGFRDEMVLGKLTGQSTSYGAAR